MPLFVRNLFFILLTLVALLYALPNFYGESPAIEINGDGLSQAQITDALKEANIAYSDLLIKEHSFLIRLADTENQINLQKWLTQNRPQWIVALNLANNTPAWLSSLGANPMKLGLDLRGGVHFLLDVDMKPVITNRLKGDSREILQSLRQANFEVAHINPQTNKITIELDKPQLTPKAIEALRSKFRDYDITGSHIIEMALNEAAIVQQTQYVIAQTIQILSNRVNELGVSEAVVQQEGNSMISVDLPGIQDTAKAKDLLGSNAQISFQLASQVPQRADGSAPMGTQWYDYENRKILLEDTPILTGDTITYAASTVNEQGNAVMIRLAGGANRFYRKTAENVGKQLAVVYTEKFIDPIRSKDDNKVWRTKTKVISVATINQALGNSFEINHLDSQPYAEKLALLLRSGALTAPYEIIEETLIGPSLGKENIQKGTYSLAFGFLCVIIFMTLYYVEFGVVANIALLLNLLFLLSLLSLLGSTLTLPGIAGIVLTVGMAVDANVLINERIREELHKGHSLIISIRAGYEKAFATIVDANVTTLIVAAILFGLGSGSIKGFAITLILGLLSSMLTSIYMSRCIIDNYLRFRTNIRIGV